jgi:hypothetical protein
MRAAAILVLCACSSGHDPAPPAPRTPGSTPHAIDAAAPLDATTAKLSDASTALATVAGDPPEPTAPQLECAFERLVTCEPGQPTRTALQRSPFEWCATSHPVAKPFYPGHARVFSAAETRRARAGQPGACCYVEFRATACD